MTCPLRMRRSRRTHRAMTAMGTAVGSLLLLAGPASAHVRVFSDGATNGAPATLRFRVPSEKADATTIRLDVTLPEGGTPTAVPAAPGWTERGKAPLPKAGLPPWSGPPLRATSSGPTNTVTPTYG
ncbi:DUF1775 domain-containing protein [Streptomyces sp. NPDC091972]|uniref:DUF1775 domain-containing protein n=1 Tax=Streptomyces sp. NPDC091972 TaxID=3366007 RepID=UPI0037F80CB2